MKKKNITYWPGSGKEALEWELRRLGEELNCLKADRNKWKYECKIAYKAFAESNIKKFYEEIHQADIEEHNRMLHEIAVLKALLIRAADALHWDNPLDHAELIAKLRKAAQ